MKQENEEARIWTPYDVKARMCGKENSKMKRLSLRPAKQTIALLVFMSASVLPFHSQEVQTPQRAQTAQSTSEQTSENLKQSNAISRTDGPVRLSRVFFVDRQSEEITSNPPAVDSTETDTNQTANKVASEPYVFPTKRERFNRYLKSTVGPLSLLHSGVSAGLNQWRDNPEEWEQGASGYGKRYASSFGRNAIRQTVIYGLDTALGLDTGFKKSQRKGFFPRMKDALAANITSRTRTGKRVISVPRLTGVYTSAIISTETWYPARYGYKDGLRSGTRSLLTGFGLNLVREFIISW